MRIRVATGFLIAFLTPLTGLSATLWSAYQDAVHNDPIFAQQKATFQQVEQTVPEARSYLLPQFLLSAQGTHTYQNSKILGNSDYNSNQYTINFSQTIFNFSQLNALRQAKLSVRAAAMLFSAQTQDLMVRFMRAYLAALQAEDLYHYTKTQYLFSKDILQMTQKKYNLKYATIIEIEQAKVQAELYRSQMITSKINAQQAMQNLSNITGVTYHHISGFHGKIPLIHLNPHNIASWVNLAKNDNLQLKAAQLDALSDKAKIETRKSDFLPNVSAVDTYSDTNQLSSQSVGSVPETIRASQVGISASWNLEQGGLTIAQVKEATSAYERSLDVMQQRYLETVTNAKNAYFGVNEGVMSVRDSQLAMHIGMSGIAHTRTAFKSGVQSIADLLQHQNRYYEAQKQYAQTLYQYILNTILLKQAAGTLSPVDIKHLNQYTLGKS